MKHLQLHFSHPLLLLTFLVGLGFALLLYFRLSKKYRKTRNRITSLVLHLVVFALAVLILAGAMIKYEIPNKENQIILLVDVSDTEEESADARDGFIETVLSMALYQDYRIGVVTFGFDQVYAVPLTDDLSSIMPVYLAAERPDTSATDIAAALTYTAGLFDNTETAKIVLVTDGKETDESAESVIRTVAAKGIRVDIANISSAYPEGDLRLTDVTVPDYHISLGEECILAVTVLSDSEQAAEIDLFDNETLIETQPVALNVGSQSVSFHHTFNDYGIHQIRFRIRKSGDAISENNVYQSYLYLEQFNHILLLEQKEGESAALLELLTSAPENYQVKTINVRTDTSLPMTLGDLCEYDQIILNNIANKDLPEGFTDLLYRYVNECGGGVFTVGGGDTTGKAHAYNRADLINTTYHELLPVQAINYTPPVAVMVIVDRSGSMSTATGIEGATKYDLALTGAQSCLKALTERDYFGLMTLDSEYATLLDLTPRSQEAYINATIQNAREVGTGGGTVFPGAIERACQALRAVDVAKRHVIVVSDGQVPETQREEYESYIKRYYEDDGITFSVVGIGITPGSAEAAKMKVACDLGGGRLHAIADGEEYKTISEMREDLNAPSIKEVNQEDFAPIVKNTLSALMNGVELATSEDGKMTSKMKVKLGGFYGVKIKPGAELVLVGDYEVPIYAQWRLGRGSVGSFMCDLNGTWSYDFLNLGTTGDDSGRKFLLNVIAALMPVENIRENDISVSVKQDNYTNKLSVFTELADGQSIVGKITNLSDPDGMPVSMNAVTEVPEGIKQTDLDIFVKAPLDASNNFSRCDFIIKSAGVYQFDFTRVDLEGNEISSLTFYRSFSYSEEYGAAEEMKDAEIKEYLDGVARHGRGTLIADNETPEEIFANFITAIEHTFDPRYLFMILVIVLFLADVAIRKFKFKWPHEIVRAIREKHPPKGGSST